MSAIAGLLHLDGRAVERIHVRRMAERMAHRGPDGGSEWADGSVALAQRMLCSTPESRHEQLPRINGRGDLVIAADARLDNRDDLIRALDAPSSSRERLTDSDLILLAYDRWHDDTPRHLVGDFAFAIWDAREQRLFCARDIYGVRPFYYWHRAGHTFAFASEIKALHALGEVPVEPNQRRIALHLANVMEDQEITFFSGVLRLPPARRLVVTRDRVSSSTYWQPDPAAELRLRSSADYGEAFREVFFEAVRCRLRSDLPVGSLLSGGIDSSSIVCAARAIMRTEARQDGSALHTFSVAYENAEGDEREFLDAVLEGGGLNPHIIPGDELNPLEELEKILWHTDEPPFAANLALNWAPYRAAGERGLRVLLDGLFGDDTLFHGKEYLSDLFRQGRWIALLLSVRQLAQNEAPSASYFLKEWALKPNAPAPVLRLWRSVRGGGEAPDYSSAHLLSNALVEDSAGSIVHRASPTTRRISTQEAHSQAVTSTWQVSALELADKCTHAFGVEARYPFADRRLIEFCLSVPPEQKFELGWTRMLARRGLEGVLPETIRWRGGKAKPGYWVGRALLRFGRDRLERLVSDQRDLLAPYVSTAVLKQTYDEYRATARVDHAGQLWRALLLAEWLETLQRKDINRDHCTLGGGITAHPHPSLPVALLPQGSERPALSCTSQQSEAL